MTTITCNPVTTVRTPDCPDWCAGRHGAPAYITEAETPRCWHASAACPPWCLGHPAHIPPAEHDHSSRAVATVSLSLPPKDTAQESPGVIDVSIWQYANDPEDPAEAVAPEPGPVVALWHSHDGEWLPDLTPDEAVALGAALIRAALMARTGTPEPCPPWCSGDHEMAEGPAVSMYGGQVRLAIPVAGHVLVHDVTPDGTRDYLRLRREIARLDGELGELTDGVASAMTAGLDAADADEAYEHAADALTEALDQGTWEGEAGKLAARPF
jgi:hypothetical protein